MNPLETYLQEVYEIYSSGVGTPETSYYGPLRTLLNEVGKTLKPKVKCIINLANRGAGLPDGGLFTPDQLQKPAGTESLPTLAARGVIEVKPTNIDAWLTAEGEQVSRYWGKYRQVLVTNLRDFLLVGQDPEGKPVKLESYRLAPSDGEFWREAAHPRRLATAHGERFIEYLKRVMLQAAPLASPKEVAWFLASYARDAKVRIEQQAELPALDTLRAALEEALGLKFEGDKGEHFFRSTLVQTIFYGVFSAWVLWSKKHLPTDTRARFHWREATWYLHVPMIKALFEQLSMPSKLEPLGLVEVLDWTETTLNRVSRADFFTQFEGGHAVQYFYEPFLEAFDPELRKELGVWYTPPEIVQYMVARVDAVLRQELEIADGLADPRVYVLDPCCGTGAYLVEVLKRISATLEEKGGDALVAHKVKKAALSRVFGFEIMPAPFVVSHLQVGLYLQNQGAPLDENTKERAGVYLTNALTGWEPPKGPKKQLVFPEMEEERDAAEEVKRDKPILVILGNPPYNAFAGVSAEAEKILVEPYKEGLVARWGIKKFNLDDLYVRFFGLAERRIAGMTKKGVICFISNFSYLGDPSFVVMRQRFLSEFDALWFDCLNGDSRETGKLTPAGKPDPSVFSTEHNREGIRVGTAICLMVRQEQRRDAPTILFRHFWGVTKRADLLESLKAQAFEVQYQPVSPDLTNRFTFRPSEVAGRYQEWPKLVDLCKEIPISGLQEMRHNALIDIEKGLLENRVRMYFNPEVDWEALRILGTGFTQTAGGFEPKSCREQVQRSEPFDDSKIMRYALYPFDLRWCYLSFAQSLWNRPRPALVAQKWPGNKFIITRMMAERPKEQICITITPELPDYHLLRPNAVAIPIFLRPTDAGKGRKGSNHPSLLEEPGKGEQSITANLSSTARAYLATLGITDPDADADAAGLVWMHALAVGYAPAYSKENADGIRQDWPRVPLPDKAEALRASAHLGRQVAALLDTESPVHGVTAGALRPEMKVVAVISKAGGGHLNPDAGDLALTAGWGHGGKAGVTMPGKGKVTTRAYTPEELAAIREGARALGLTPEQALEHLGESTFDIYLNDVAYWRNVPEKVWTYYIGGYQVIKKWLSYREKTLLGRSLTPEEIDEVTHMAGRLTALVLLEPLLNDNYHQAKDSSYQWPTSKT